MVDWQVCPLKKQLKELPVGTKPVSDPGKCQDTFSDGCEKEEEVQGQRGRKA